MSKKKDRYVVGLDIGTHKVCAIVAQITPPPAGAAARAETDFMSARLVHGRAPRRGRSISVGDGR